MAYIEEHIVAELLTTSYTAPSLVDFGENIPLIDAHFVMRFISMDSTAVLDILTKMGIKPIPFDMLSEDLYIMCDDNLIYLGQYRGGYIPSKEIAVYSKRCSNMFTLHSHPVPLPIPTYEDVLSAYQLGSSRECVISRRGSIAELICIKPRYSWRAVVEAMEKSAMDFYRIFRRYVVVAEFNNVLFIPYPSSAELEKAIDLVGEILRDRATVLYTKLNMDNGIYTSKYL